MKKKLQSSNVAREAGIKWPPPPQKWEEEFEGFLINPEYMATIEKGAKIPFIKSRETEYNKELKKRIYSSLLKYLVSGEVKVKVRKGAILIERIE